MRKLGKINESLLERNQFSERITEKILWHKGCEIEPTIHEGYVAREIEKEVNFLDRCEENRQIQKEIMQKSTRRSGKKEKD